jgi:hypothetical protein
MRKQHRSPIPWTLDSRGFVWGADKLFVFRFEHPSLRASAEFIVRAVNAHDELLTALSTVLAQYRLFIGPDDPIARVTIKVATDALKKAQL